MKDGKIGAPNISGKGNQISLNPNRAHLNRVVTEKTRKVPPL